MADIVRLPVGPSRPKYPPEYAFRVAAEILRALMRGVVNQKQAGAVSHACTLLSQLEDAVKNCERELTVYDLMHEAVGLLRPPYPEYDRGELTLCTHLIAEAGFSLITEATA